MMKYTNRIHNVNGISSHSDALGKGVQIHGNKPIPIYRIRLI